jgi:signal transduction histidine kinase
MVTVLDDRDARMRGLRAGAEDFLTKPLDRAELTLRVRNLLRLKAYADAYDTYSQTLEAAVSARTAELVEQQQTLQQQAVVLSEQASMLGQHAIALAAALERAELANQAKDRLLMTVSHELRTPLNTIVGWTDILMTRRDQRVLERALPVIKRNALAQVEVIDQLLDAANLGRGRMQLELRSTDLRPIVRDAIELVRPLAAAKRIAITSSGDSTPLIVFGDRVRLQQVMRNLLSNAVKFSADGGTVRVHAQALSGGVRLEVSDSGVGLAAGVLPQVFERFFRADESSTREHGGLGLGLTIVRELVEMQGGTVRASSEGLTQGASFVIDLPVHRADGSVSTTVRDGAAMPLNRS